MAIKSISHITKTFYDAYYTAPETSKFEVVGFAFGKSTDATFNPDIDYFTNSQSIDVRLGFTPDWDSINNVTWYGGNDYKDYFYVGTDLDGVVINYTKAASESNWQSPYNNISMKFSIPTRLFKADGTTPLSFDFDLIYIYFKLDDTTYFGYYANVSDTMLSYVPYENDAENPNNKYIFTIDLTLSNIFNRLERKGNPILYFNSSLENSGNVYVELDTTITPTIDSTITIEGHDYIIRDIVSNYENDMAIDYDTNPKIYNGFILEGSDVHVLSLKEGQNFVFSAVTGMLTKVDRYISYFPTNVEPNNSDIMKESRAVEYYSDFEKWWTPYTNYVQGDIVRIKINNVTRLYRCVNNETSAKVFDETNWENLIDNTALTKTYLSKKGKWLPSTVYELNDVVETVYNGYVKYFICIIQTDGSALTFESDIANWIDLEELKYKLYEDVNQFQLKILSAFNLYQSPRIFDLKKQYSEAFKYLSSLKYIYSLPPEKIYEYYNLYIENVGRFRKLYCQEIIPSVSLYDAITGIKINKISLSSFTDYTISDYDEIHDYYADNVTVILNEFDYEFTFSQKIVDAGFKFVIFNEGDMKIVTKYKLTSNKIRVPYNIEYSYGLINNNSSATELNPFDVTVKKVILYGSIING